MNQENREKMRPLLKSVADGMMELNNAINAEAERISLMTKNQMSKEEVAESFYEMAPLIGELDFACHTLIEFSKTAKDGKKRL